MKPPRPKPTARVKPERKKARGRRDRKPGLEPRPYRFVIVDDEPGIHEAIRYTLGGSNEFLYRESYFNGTDALKGILANPPDLVLMDIRLPDISGIECTRRLLAECPGLAVVMISALDDRLTVGEAIQAGCRTYVTKPFGSTQLQAQLLCALAEHPMPALHPLAPTANCPLRLSQPDEVCLVFTARQAKVLQALALGRMYKEIADDFGLSLTLTHKLATQAFDKLNVKRRPEAVTRWLVCRLCSRCVIRSEKRSAAGG